MTWPARVHSSDFVRRCESGSHIDRSRFLSLSLRASRSFGLFEWNTDRDCLPGRNRVGFGKPDALLRQKLDADRSA